MKSDVKYTFKQISHCNMCGAPVSQHAYLGRRLNQSQGKNPAKKPGVTVSVYKCRMCRLVFSNPMPVPENIHDHYNINPEEYWAEDYFVRNRNYFKNEIRKIKDFLPEDNQIRSLDIGAGLGKQMISLTEEGIDAYGIEPSRSFYEMALEKFGIAAEKLQNTSIETAEFPGEYFDFISFGAVLEHLYDPSASIKKALFWLKPGGIIHIAVPSSDWFVAKLINLYFRFRGTRFVTNLSPMHEPYHLYEFSEKTFQIHAEQNNYQIAEISHFVDKTYLPPRFDFILKPYMKKTHTGMAMIVWLKKK
jgi:SAM-dependent methyltransferase